MTETDDICKLGAAADVCVELSVVAGKTQISLKQLAELKEGAILELDKMVGEPVELYINGVVAAKGELMLSGNELGVRIAEIVINGGADED